MGEAQESSAACLTKGGRERRERERERGGERERRHDVDNDVWYVVLRQAFERLHPRERLETGQAQVATPRGSSETKACRDGLGRTVGILFGWFRLRELRDTSPTEAGEGRRRRALLLQRQSKLAHHGRCRRREWLVRRRSRPGLVCAGALAPRRSRREELIHFRGRPLQHSRLRSLQLLGAGLVYLHYRQLNLETGGQVQQREGHCCFEVVERGRLWCQSLPLWKRRGFLPSARALLQLPQTASKPEESER